MRRLFFLMAGMFAMGFEDYLFAGLLPGVAVSLHTSVVAVAQGCTTYSVAYVLAVPLCAFLLSKRPVRHVLITALVLFLIGNVATLLSPSVGFYIASRFVAGLSSGLFLPVAVAAAIQFVEPGFRARAMGAMWTANSVGAVVGVPLGLKLADRMGWQASVILILFLATFALVGLVLRRQAFRVEGPPPSLRAQFSLLANRRVLSVIGVTLLTATGCLGLYAYISPMLEGTPNSADVAFTLWSVGGLIGSSLIGSVVDRTGKPKVVMVAILAVLLVTIAAIPTMREVPVLGLLPFLIWGGMGWASVTPQLCSLTQIEPDREAILVALNSSAVSLGGAVGTALGGLALSGGLGVAKLPYITAAFVLCALASQIHLLREAGPVEAAP